MDSTSKTLLLQLRQPDAATAWERFCLLYASPIIRYGQKIGLSEADARDVLQETLIMLMRQMPTFDYDPRRRFRNFLLTIVHRNALAIFRKRKRRPEISLDETSAQPRILRMADRSQADDANAEARWQETLFDDAWSRLQRSGKLQPRTIEIFTEYAIQGCDCEIVSKKHGVADNTVHQVRNRVIAMLKDEVRKLMAELEPGESGNSP